MTVTLNATNFQINNDNDNDDNANTAKPVAPPASAIWTWSISPKKLGGQKIKIDIYGKMDTDGQTWVVTEKSISRIINVIDKSMANKTIDAIFSNTSRVIGTGGPLGLLRAYLTYRFTKKQVEKNTLDLQKKVEMLEKKLEELSEGTEHDKNPDDKKEQPRRSPRKR